jgi:single-strand DNA-binding protein
VFDTNIAVVGNVLNAPEWRRIASSGALVANFRVASTARRYDRENGRWIDGNNLRVRVVAWRRLAEGIASSITVGDPVIVYGRLYTRDWKDEQGNPRVSYEMEAFSIGHDLARGRARFFRNKAVLGTGTVEDAEAQSVLGGEPTDPVTAEEVPVGYGEGLPERLPDELEPTFAEQKQKQEQEQEQKQEEDEEQEREPASEQSPEAGPADDDELTLEVERLVAEQPTAARRGRRAKREPVAA